MSVKSDREARRNGQNRHAGPDATSRARHDPHDDSA
jgi:hypothetical protein